MPNIMENKHNAKGAAIDVPVGATGPLQLGLDRSGGALLNMCSRNG